jgi:precorrin-6A/cobalt-precorrin-6A reductase
LPPHITPLIARPPFTIEAEVDTFTRLGITHLVSKNAGGTGAAKLDAAARLGLPVIMIARPPQPPGQAVTTPEEAVAWALQTAGNGPGPANPGVSD